MTKVQFYGWAFYVIGFFWGVAVIKFNPHIALTFGISFLVGVAISIFEPKARRA